MTYFVTGATGFIGRFLVQELLNNREGDVHVLARARFPAPHRRTDPPAGATPTASTWSRATSA